VGAASLAAAGVFMIAGTFVANAIVAALLISLAGAASNFLLGATWATCVDIGGRHSGVVSAAMNSFGQLGGILSPIVVALLVEHYGSWSAPLYITGALYLIGAACWLGVDPSRPL
jgi:ACS family glucarate transporter-like MFS transporter